jgi:uncharacterized protein (DUF362 family)
VTGLASARREGIPESSWYDPEVLESMVSGLLKGVQPAPPGCRVLVKPNWVYHSNGGRGADCLHTHSGFVLAALKAVLRWNPSSVVIGDAPVQGCNWSSLVTDEFRRQAASLAGSVPVELSDFRRTILPDGNLRKVADRAARSGERFILFDLAGDSLLEPVSVPPGRFRVTMYDPRLLAGRHFPGRHQYLIAREALEADVILNLPKLKTHRKAGITGSLKNLVGINGNKEFLPHHRTGGTRDGGDCYPGRSLLKRLAEISVDRANMGIGRAAFSRWIFLAGVFLWARRTLAGEFDIEGGWSGNDTVWRTVLDINRIALYGRTDGTMGDVPARRILTLTDALICGQGEGPLRPDPFPMGFVVFSEDPVEADLLHCALMGYEPGLIPTVRNAEGSFRWPFPGSRSREAAHRIVAESGGLPGTPGPRPATGWECLRSS